MLRLMVFGVVVTVGVSGVAHLTAFVIAAMLTGVRRPGTAATVRTVTGAMFTISVGVLPVLFPNSGSVPGQWGKVTRLPAVLGA